MQGRANILKENDLFCNRWHNINECKTYKNDYSPWIYNSIY